MLPAELKHSGILLKYCYFCIASIYSFSHNKVNGNAKQKEWEIASWLTPNLAFQDRFVPIEQGE